jgi:protein TonB
MFADSFCDSGWSNRSHRGWTTLLSFAVQALAISCLLFLPLFYTQRLPRLAALAPRLLPAPPAPVPAAQHTNPASVAQSNMMGVRLVSPPRIPQSISMLTESVPPPPMVDPGALGVSHGTGDPGARGTVPGGILGGDQILPPPPPPVPHPRRSQMMEGNLVLRVQPDYPAAARQLRVQGKVVLRVLISREGVIENLEVVSGHPMLVRAAVDAVRQWRYRPYVLNGDPVEVETEVTVNFVLSGGL